MSLDNTQNMSPEDAGQALIGALTSGDYDYCAELITGGADLNQHGGRTDATPLMVAAALDTAVLLQDMIAHGADIHATNNRGQTALMCAAHHPKGYLSLEILADQDGAKLDAQDHNGDTALTLAVRAQKRAGSKYLIMAGADIHTPNRNGDTALTLAAVHKDMLPIVRILVKKGAHIDTQNNDGQTALDIARIVGNAEVADFLEKEKERVLTNAMRKAADRGTTRAWRVIRPGTKDKVRGNTHEPR
ncbi:MAG: ankyrin repeat domain-containing protein [Alphaproteobacteria bacterium]|nr:ankyrin repeat domain-containing protein [Alphaproteobacteria bacterium]